MQVKVLLALVATSLVAGLPEPEAEPEPDPDTKVDVRVDSGDKKLDNYLQVVKTVGETSFNFVSKLLGEAKGYNCCKVQVSSWPDVYQEYPNGAKDVPCGGLLVGKNGTCVDGNVVCEADNVGPGSVTITINIDNGQTNKTINVKIHSGQSLFDAMHHAQQESKLSFTYKKYPTMGAMITSINGLYNTEHCYWMVYNCTNGCHQTKGVSITYPNNGDIYTFRYECYIVIAHGTTGTP